MVKTRFAPSPTGSFLHIGSLRTALYSFLIAKQNGGRFILRIEDTDRTRFVEGASDAFLRTLYTFGIPPDEGYGVGGESGPYVQTARIELYQSRLHQMVADGFAYYCFATPEEVEKDRSEKEALGLPTSFQSPYRDLPYSEARKRVDAGDSYSIRLKVPKGEKIVVEDLIRGRLEWSTNEVEDQILLKTGGIPTYHGAVVIDDDLMGITHVLRGEEWVSSYPKQVLTARALGIQLPAYGHLPNILWSDRKKLSKRNGDVDVDNFLRDGYLVEAIINYIVLLGWNPKTTEEFFTMDELIARFRVEHIQKAGAVFDPEKLKWMNTKYIARMETEALHDRLEIYLQTYREEFVVSTWGKYPREYHLAVIREIAQRLPLLSDYPELSRCIYETPKSYDLSLFFHAKMKVTSREDVIRALDIIYPILESESADHVDHAAFESRVIAAIAEAGLKNWQILYPVRVALTAAQFSPGAFEMIMLLGRDESLRRLTHARNSI